MRYSKWLKANMSSEVVFVSGLHSVSVALQHKELSPLWSCFVAAVFMLLLVWPVAQWLINVLFSMAVSAYQSVTMENQQCISVKKKVFVV